MPHVVVSVRLVPSRDRAHAPCRRLCLAEEEADLLLGEIGTAAELAVVVSQRVAGMSLEHVLGWADFCGLRVAVSPGVFVPRRRTELLVEQAIAVTPSCARVVDLCCGTGAVGMAVASATDPAILYAVDVDPLATECARDNIGPRGHVLTGGLYEPLPPGLRGTVDTVVANAPYVPTDAIEYLPAEARDNELAWRSTAAAMAWPCSGGWPPARRRGWSPVATYSSRPASTRQR